VHALATHAMPVAWETELLQFLLQLPHCVMLLEVFVSQPVLPCVQWLNPELQFAIWMASTTT